MIHSFKFLERFFLLDVVSGSLFEIDNIAYNLLIREQATFNAKDFDGTISQYAKQDELEVAMELEELVKQGVLMSKELHNISKKAQGYKAMCLNVCHDCNLDCEYCFASNNVANKSFMNFETAKKAIDMLVSISKNRRQLEIDFFGGEPTLNFDMIKQTVEYCHLVERNCDKKFRFTITTNALNLTDDMIAFFNLEMYNVVLSIDGRENIHNKLRPTKGRKDSYSTILNNIKRFVKKRGNGQYYVRGTYTANNLDFSNDVLSLADLGFNQISFEPVVLPSTHALALKKEHNEQIFAEYEKLAKEVIQRRKTEDKWLNFFHFYIDLKGGPCESKRLSGCGAGCEYLAIAPNGDIYPCHQFVGEDKYKIGNVYTNIEFDIKNVLDTNDITTKPKCQECFAKYYCSGGCIANAAMHGSGIKGNYDVACPGIKKRIECALGMYAIEH